MVYTKLYGNVLHNKVKPLFANRPHLFLYIATLITLTMLFVGLTGCSIPESTPIAKVSLSDNGVYAADIHAQKQLSVVSQVNGEVKVYDLRTNTALYSWRHQGDGLNLVDTVKFSDDGNYVVTCDSDAFAIWSVETGEPIGFWRIDESTIRDIAIANNARAVLVGKADGSVMFFEPQTQRRLEFIAHEQKINSVDLSANGRYALTGGNDYKAYLWDTNTAQIIHVFEHPHRVTKVVIDQMAAFLFTADGQDKAQIWDAQSGKEVSRLHFIERQMVFTAAKFSSDGEYLLTGSPSKRLALWEVATGKMKKQWRVAPSNSPPPRSAVVYSVDFINSQAVSVSSSGNYEKWAIENESN